MRNEKQNDDELRDDPRVAAWAEILIDETGELRPIERISFEPLGSKVRWSVYSEGRLLQAFTTTMDDVGELLEATGLFLATATGDPGRLLTEK